MLHLLACRRTRMQGLPQHALVHLQSAAGHNIVECRHATKQRDILEGARNALTGGNVGPHLAALLALECDRAFLRMIETVDDVEHRCLAGAVGADDSAYLALANTEADIRDRL